MEPLTIGSGSLLAERFQVEEMVRAGGMGVIYRAHDRQTGKPVALKVLRSPEARPHEVERFLREARVLSELCHPGIAAYVANGRTPEGESFLAMEWLEGEDLAERLARQPLSAQESLLLVRVVADALATVHRHGVVHRDIKPSNVFLRERQVEQAVLLDFGIARGGPGAWSVTRTGEVVGTIHYVAPEQARGEREMGPEADVFSLGCVLYECLTGTPPFSSGDHAAVVLARILCEEAPPLRQLRPDLPESLEVLLGRMLAKERAHRFADGKAVLEALEALGTMPELLGTASMLRPRGRVEGEQHLVSVVLAIPGPPSTGSSRSAGSADSAGSGSSSAERAAGGESKTAQRRVEQTELQALLGVYGAKIHRLANEAIMATLVDARHTATDQATAAARCALALRARFPGATVVVATGRGVSAQGRTMGEAIARAGRLLEASAVGARAGSEDPEPPPVWLDELTAGLLDTQFHARRVETGVFRLQGERMSLDETRLVLGRPTPCVGREQEVRLLEMALMSCREEPGAQVVLVTGAPGVGKSRLRHEFLRRLKERHEGVEILSGRGDPLQRGTAYGLLGQALRRWVGREDGPEAQRARLTERVGRHVVEASRRGMAEFLGELCGQPFPDEDSAALRAARQDPRTMSDGVTDAVVEFLRAECEVHPVMLVLEDLHWGDPGTVRVVDVALRELADRPLLVLALARPEVKELFPRLWEGRRVQELRLSELGRRMSERLVEAVLGDRAEPEAKARIVAQAGGNALFLEELIRAVAEGAGGELPETVLAMLQGRFLRFEPGARRLLRAASVLGETFWRGGLLALLGSEKHMEHEVGRWLEILVEAETIVLRPRGRFAGEEEFAFRHALMRDAAYSLMTDEDRVVGHRLAAEYLEEVGESDPMVLAEHYQRGQEPGRAAGYFTRAARRALEASDHAGALERAAQATNCGAAGELLGQLRAIETLAHMWTWNFPAAYAAGQAALGLLAPGSVDWYQTLGPVLTADGCFLQHEALRTHVQLLTETVPEPGAESASIEPTLMALVQAGAFGLREPVARLLERAEAVCARLGESEARAQGLLRMARCLNWLTFDGDAWLGLKAAEEAQAYFTAAGDLRYQCAVRGLAGLALTLIGDHEVALAELQTSLGALERLEELAVQGAVRSYYVLALAELGTAEALGQAQAMATGLLAVTPTSFWCTLQYMVLVRALLAGGAAAQAEETARQATERFAQLPPGKMVACTLWSQALLALGRAEEARARAEEGLAILGQLGGRCFYDTALRVAAAEAYQVLQDPVAARAQLTVARRDIERRAAWLPDEKRRERFWHRVPSHARVIELERRWS